MAELTNIKNQALTERIEDHLFQYILDGHLAVGAQLLLPAEKTALPEGAALAACQALGKALVG